MKSRMFQLLIIIIFSGLGFNCDKKVDFQKEEKQIKEVWNKTSENLAKHDWENYSKCYLQTEKLQMIHPGTGQWLNGWDEFSKVYKNILESDYTYTEYENELLNVNINKSSDMAWANAKVAWSMNPNQKNRMWYAVAFEKVNGEWKIVMAMACGVPNAE